MLAMILVLSMFDGQVLYHESESRHIRMYDICALMTRTHTHTCIYIYIILYYILLYIYVCVYHIDMYIHVWIYASKWVSIEERKICGQASPKPLRPIEQWRP